MLGAGAGARGEVAAVSEALAVLVVLQCPITHSEHSREVDEGCHLGLSAVAVDDGPYGGYVVHEVVDLATDGMGRKGEVGRDYSEGFELVYPDELVRSPDDVHEPVGDDGGGIELDPGSCQVYHDHAELALAVCVRVHHDVRLVIGTWGDVETAGGQVGASEEGGKEIAHHLQSRVPHDNLVVALGCVEESLQHSTQLAVDCAKDVLGDARAEALHLLDVRLALGFP